MRKIALAVLCCLALGLGASAGEKKFTVGYVEPYLQGWFAYLADAFELVMKKEDIKTVRLLSNYEPQAEIKAVQDLIGSKVDAIHICSGSPDTAQYVSELANKAGIPISIQDASLAEGPGKPYATIEFDWKLSSKLWVEQVSKKWPGAKVVCIQGLAGAGPVEWQNQGMYETAKEVGNVEIVNLSYADYQQEKAFAITKDLLQSGLKFDVAVGGCQEITAGIVEALRAAGQKKVVISVNGGPMDIDMFAAGDIDGCISQSPGFQGLLCALTVVDKLQGKPSTALVKTPQIWVGKEEYKEKLIPWEVDEKWIPIARNFMATGKLEY